VESIQASVGLKKLCIWEAYLENMKILNAIKILQLNFPNLYELEFKLELDKSTVDDETAEKLGEALSSAEYLRYLRLRMKFSDAGFISVMSGVARNRSIHMLEIAVGHYSEDTMQQVDCMFQDNISLAIVVKPAQSVFQQRDGDVFPSCTLRGFLSRVRSK
jgi:hypothetical protein